MMAVFLKSLIIGYSGAVMPGPMLTYTIDKSIQRGAKSGLLVSFGHAVVELLLVIFLFVGAGKYLTMSISKTIIGIIGGIILVYMGFGMIKDVYLNKISLNIEKSKDTKKGSMPLVGALLSISNPYFIIWWVAVGLALIMSAYASFGIKGILVFYVGHILSDISWFTLVSVLISKTRCLINVKVYKCIIIFLAGCLMFFGVKFFISSI